MTTILLSHQYSYAAQVTLSWNAPTTNVDGTPITYFSGDYRIYYGTASGNYSQLTNLNNSNSIVTQQVSNLTDGQAYFFVVTAVNTLGNESGYSNEISKTAQSVTPTTYTITASAGTNGTVTPSGATTVNSGAGQAYSITPSAGYHVASVLVDGSSVGTVTSYTFSNVTANHTISATFTKDTYTAITSANKTTFTVGTAGSFTVTKTGYPTPTLSMAGALPTGVTFNTSTGVLSGTPATGSSGVYNLTFTAANGVAANTTQNFTLTVNQASAITSANNATFTVGTAGTFTVTASGYPSPTLSITGTLPTGVSFDTETGVLRGTPQAGTVGLYNLTISSTNWVTPNALQSFTLTVEKAGTTTTISSDIPDPSVKGDSYKVSFAVSTDSGSPTGSVTVSDGTDSCSADVSAGSCQLTSTTAGTKTLIATYVGDASFKGSTSSGIAHRVLDLFTLTVTGSGIDGGTMKNRSIINATWDGSVTGGDDTERLAGGTGPHIITAAAKTGEKVTWMGNCDITAGNNTAVATCTINSMTGNRSVQAVFMHKVPSAPIALTAKVLNEKKVSLSWTDVSGNEYGVRIERQEGVNAYKLIKTVGVGVKTFTNTGLTPGKTYTYRVMAYNDGGNSAYSNEAVAALTTPDAPSRLKTKSVSPAEVVIVWTDNSSIEKGFKLQRKTGFCNSTATWTDMPDAIGADITEHIDNGLDPKTAYSYRIKAYSTGSESPYSNCYPATTGKAGTPHSPTELEAAGVDRSTIELTWQDNSDNETSFRIYRRLDSGAWALLFTTGAGATDYTDTSAVNNDTTARYSYHLTACNATGCSPASAEAAVPQPFSALIAVPEETGGIRLDWTPANGTETGQVIYRKTGDCSSADAWLEIEGLAKVADSYKDASVASASVYSYVIMSFTESLIHPLAYGYSVQGNCASAIAP